jgi:Type I phosphodiesterase / nucleotide pyrophosphatase
MLTNAAAGGVLAAAYLAVLVLQLNPQVPIVSMTALRWFAILIAFYGLYLSVALYLLILVREVLASRPLRPAWFSVRLLAWVSAVYAAAAAVATWGNLKGFRAVLSESAAERMRHGALATSILVVVIVSLILVRRSFGRRFSRVTGLLLVVTMALPVALPLWWRGPGDVPVQAPPRSPVPFGASVRAAAPTLDQLRQVPHVRLLLLDGASLGFIRQRVAVGQLPNFGRLLDRGAAIDLATLKPAQAEPVWAAAMTGKYPPKNGIRSNAIYRVLPDDTDPVDLLPDYCFAAALTYQGFLASEGQTSAALRARPLWDILADYQIVSGIVNLPLTRPAHGERGYLISDYFDEAASSPLRLADPQAGYPTSAVDIARQVFDVWQAKPWTAVMPPSAPDEPVPTGIVRARWDHAYSEAAAELNQEFAPRLTAVRYESPDALGHWYLEDAEPELYGRLPGPERGRSVLDRDYAFIDDEVGRAVASLGPNDLLLVVSGFGMEPVTLPKRLLARLLGRPDWTGGHESAPDGFLLAYGSNVAHGQFPRGSIVDLTPTVLYYMGLAVGRDMDGFARTDLFVRSYTLEHPVTFVATHERLADGQPPS